MDKPYGPYTLEFLMELHKKCSNNREALLKSTHFGCFCCLTIDTVDKIKEWHPESRVDPVTGERVFTGDVTAICPCFADAVLAGSEVELSQTPLRAMHNMWFAVACEIKDGVRVKAFCDYVPLETES